MSIGKCDDDSGYISPKAIDKAIDVIDEQVDLDHTHDIPYCGGYSKDGRTIYLDRNIPTSYKQKDGRTVDVTRYLKIHECIEKCLMDHLDLDYESAHAFATCCEMEALEADGVDEKQYNDFWDEYIPEEEDKSSYEDVPDDLDMRPYDDEHDVKVEHRMHFGSILDSMQEKAMRKTPKTDPYDYPAGKYGVTKR